MFQKTLIVAFEAHKTQKCGFPKWHFPPGLQQMYGILILSKSYSLDHILKIQMLMKDHYYLTV